MSLSSLEPACKHPEWSTFPQNYQALTDNSRDSLAVSAAFPTVVILRLGNSDSLGTN